MDSRLRDGRQKNAEDFAYFMQVTQFIEQHGLVIQALLVSNYDYRLVQKWKETIKFNLWERLKPERNSVGLEIKFEMISSEAISAWIYHIQQDTIQSSRDANR